MISRLFTRIRLGHVSRTRIRAGESAEQPVRTLKIAQDVARAREQWNAARATRERD